MWRLPITLTAADFNAGLALESWCCVDCGVNTAPEILPKAEFKKSLKNVLVLALLRGDLNPIVTLHITDESEVYTVLDKVWKAAGMAPMGGCLCIGCLEKRLGRRLKPKDFKRRDTFNNDAIPGTPRLLQRQGRAGGEIDKKPQH